MHIRLFGAAVALLALVGSMETMAQELADSFTGPLVQLREAPAGEKCGSYFYSVPSKVRFGATALYFTFESHEKNGRNFINLVDQAEVSHTRIRVDNQLPVPVATFLGNGEGLMHWEISLSAKELSRSPCLQKFLKAA